MKVVSTPETLNFFEEEYQKCSIRYGDMKKQLAADIAEFIAPIHDKILSLRNNDEYLRKIAKMGAEKARENAAKTIKDVREIIGMSTL